MYTCKIRRGVTGIPLQNSNFTLFVILALQYKKQVILNP